MKDKGFTLVELLITMAIMIVLGLVLFSSYSGKKNATDLSSATQEIVTLLHEAQSRTIAGDQNGTAGIGFWGVQLSNPSGTSPFYALLYATSTARIASGTVIGHYPLPTSVAYASSSIPTGGALYVYYANGLPSGGALGAYEICSGYSCPTGTSTIVIGLSTRYQKPPISSVISVVPTGEVSY